MPNARDIARELLIASADPAYAENIRRYQGCPTLAVTRGGKLFLGWYSGGTREPHIENYNLVMTSTDRGESWQGPLLVIPSSRAYRTHALDIQLFVSPENKLYVFWVQNDCLPESEWNGGKAEPNQPLCVSDGWVFNDFSHNMWVSVCDEPDAQQPVFSAPRRLDSGFLRCKPLVLPSGRWILFNYNQMSDRYEYSTTDDRLATLTHRAGGKKVPTHFDECMAYRRLDGSVRLLARNSAGELAESFSNDDGLTWTDGQLSGIDNPDTRFFVARTPGGRILLVNNDDRKTRKNMSVWLSDDDGATWKWKRTIDGRTDVSYPDCDFFGDEIFLTYDRERTGAREILFCRFTEEDIMDASRPLKIRVVSKP